MQIIIYGGASKKKYVYPVLSDELEMNLLDWCKKHQVPVASSCDGQQICRRCIFNHRELACKYLMKDILKENLMVEFSYL